MIGSFGLVGLFGGIDSDSTCFRLLQIWLCQIGGNVTFDGRWLGSGLVCGGCHIGLCWWLGHCLSLLDLLLTFFRIRGSSINSCILRGLSLIQLCRIFVGVLGEVIGDWLGGNACPISLRIRLCNLCSCGSLSVILHHRNIIILRRCINRLRFLCFHFLLRLQLFWLHWLWLWWLWWLWWCLLWLLLWFLLRNWLLIFGLLFLGWIYRWRLLLGRLRLGWLCLWLRLRLWLRWLLIDGPWQRFLFLLDWLRGLLL